MSASARSLSVLVIDEHTDVLAFFARILDAAGIRTLLARNAAEAVGIAERGYVPIDLVLANVLLSPDPAAPEPGNAPDLVDRLRRLRPALKALYMLASIDGGVIRIEFLESRLHHMSRTPDDRNLVDTIRDAATARPAGGLKHGAVR